jgi:serine/threonine-protein kinase
MHDLELERDAVALFERALEIDENGSDEWIAARAADRPELLSRVTAMMQAHRRAMMRTGAATDALEEEAPPERIGAYRITALIGRGGMGSVYRGERMTGDFEHVVAIKIIKPGLLSETLVERFRRERQLLAGLSHPNIAHLHDGGETESGSPYFVMEHVDGLPLLQWVEERRPSRAERLRLFRDICGAVAFAHRSLIVHRDLTPSNVLITHEGVVKLIDFGIAKPADDEPDLSERPSVGSLSLTPGYAAPERMTSSGVTTATDIYSLGKVLAKLVLPEPGDRELKAIIARATANDPIDRYPTADALSMDLSAWESGFPVAAAAGGRRYAARKFIGRHRFGLATAAAALLLLLAGFGITLDAYSRAEAARRAESARFEELRSLARYMLFELNGRLERVAGNTEARVTLANRAQHYLSALASSPGADEDLKLEAAQGLVALARAQGVPAQPNLGDTERARANLQKAISMLRRLQLPPTVKAADLAQALVSLAMIQAHADSNIKGADTLLAEARSLLAAVPAGGRLESWHLARRQLRHGQLEMTTLGQRPDEMLRIADLVEAEIDQWPARMRRSREADFDRAFALYHRGLHGYFTDKLDPAIPMLRRAERMYLALDRALPNDPAVLYAMLWNAYVGYGTASGVPGRKADAAHFLDLAIRTSERLLQIEANDHSLKSFAGNLRQIEAQALSEKGDHRGAAALQAEVISLYQGALGPGRRAAPLNRLANAQVAMGDIARAAGDRTLACSSYRAARADIAELKQRDELFGFVESHRSGLDANIARCARGAPLSEMMIFN